MKLQPHGAASMASATEPARFVTPSGALRAALCADAVVSGAAAALQLLAGNALNAATGLPSPLLLGTGVFMVGYVALLALLASRARLWRPLVGLVIVGNGLWALGCVALAFDGPAAINGLGQAYLLVHALGVALLAAWQAFGLRRSMPAQ
jgi:hypothetical protein